MALISAISAIKGSSTIKYIKNIATTQIESVHSASIWLFSHHCMVDVPQRGTVKDFSGPVTFISVSQYKNKINSKNALRASHSPSLRDLHKIKAKEKKNSLSCHHRFKYDLHASLCRLYPAETLWSDFGLEWWFLSSICSFIMNVVVIQ